MLMVETSIKRLVRPGEFIEVDQDAVLDGLYRFRSVAAPGENESLAYADVVRAAGVPEKQVNDGLGLAIERGLVRKAESGSYLLSPDGVAYVERYRSQAFPMVG